MKTINGKQATIHDMLVWKIANSIASYIFQGDINHLYDVDGEQLKKELDSNSWSLTTEEATVNTIYLDAMEADYMWEDWSDDESPVEAKHLRFMGKEWLMDVIKDAVKAAWQNSRDEIEYLMKERLGA